MKIGGKAGIGSAFVGLLLLAGCAQPNTAPPPPRASAFEAFGATGAVGPRAQGPVLSTPKSQVQQVSLLRYVGTDTSNWNHTGNSNYSDLYSMLEIYVPIGSVGVGSGIPLRNYDKENRSWIERLLFAQTNSVTTVANVQVANPSLKFTVPLFSVTHASGRGLGNTWTTSYDASNVESAWFRIDANTGITVHINVKASSDLKSQAASAIVSAVTQAVKIAAPQTTLLTTLSKSDVTNTANAIDTAISGLFSQDITEDVELGRLSETWAPGASIQITGCAPYVGADGPPPAAGARNGNCSSEPDLDGAIDAPVGTWTLDLHCPRISMFDPRDICHNPMQPLGAASSPMPVIALRTQAALNAAKQLIVDNVSYDNVLRFMLSSQVSIAAYAKAQIWYSNFIKNKSPKSADAAEFCLSAKNDLNQQGLSDFDAGLAVRAMVTAMPDLVGQQRLIDAGCTGLPRKTKAS